MNKISKEAVRIVTIVAVQSIPKTTRELGRVLRRFYQPILPAFRKDDKTALCPDSRIRSGLGKETVTPF